MQLGQVIELQMKNQIAKPGKTGLDWYLFCYFLEKYQDQPMLEVGIGNGGSLFTMCNFSHNVVAVDNWCQGWSKQVVLDVIQKLNLQVNFCDQDFATFHGDQFAFVHLDASKSFEGTLQDLYISSQIATDVICVDDYMNSTWPEVTWAVDEFCKINTAWKKIFIGNHQIFLAQNNVQIKDLITELPVINRHDTWYLTYGDLPDHIMPFIESGKMQYTWHWLAWINKDKSIL